MKKINLALTTLFVTTLLSSCQQGKHITISTNNNGNKITLEYNGKIAFTDDSTAIKSMSKHSYIKFEKDNQKLSAERNVDPIVYKHQDGTQSATLSDREKHLIADVIHTTVIKTDKH